MAYDPNPTSRFSDRVENYVKFRPGYPTEILSVLRRKYGFNSQSVVIDVGSGTGISARLFLKNGNPVYAVEPNSAMREAAEQALGSHAGFHSVDGASEATSLPNHFADFVIAAQAFHWFNPEPTQREFGRILKEGGRIVLIWNDRKTSGSAFSEEYEALIVEYSTDYRQVNHKNIDDQKIKDFLAGPFDLEIFASEQVLDFEGLLGRLMSSSYALKESDPRYPEMHEKLRRLFDRHQQDGAVRIEYETKMYINRI